MAISRLLTHTTPISIPLRWFSSSTFTVLATTGDTAHGGGRGARRHGCSITPLQRRMGTGGDMLADAGVAAVEVAAVEVDEVIPVGGATQMPLLPAMFETDVCRHRTVHVIEPRCRGGGGGGNGDYGSRHRHFAWPTPLRLLSRKR